MSKTPVTIILPNIRSAMNIGAIFRTADAMGAEKIILSGYSATPSHPKVTKTSLGAENTIKWEYSKNLLDTITTLRQEGYQIVALEKNINSVNIWEFKPSFPVALIVGNEIHGVDPEVQAICDQVVHLPMLGTKESLNVATATGIALYELLKRYSCTP